MYKKILINSILFLGSVFFIFMRSQHWETVAETEAVNLIDKNFEAIHDTLLLLPLALVFSIIASFLSNEAFRRWSHFAAITIPPIIAIAFITGLELHHTGGGFINIEKDIDILFILSLYGLFVVGSIIQIWRGYRASRDF